MSTFQKVGEKMTNFRWIICGLLFFATTVNYLDRQVLSLTWKDFIAPEFHWTDSNYGDITAIFSIVYAIANLFAGRFIDVLDLFDRKTGRRTRSDLFGYERHGLRIGIFFHSTGRRHTESQSRDLLAFLTGTQIKIPVLGFVRNFVLTGQHDILLPVAEIDQTCLLYTSPSPRD